MLNPADVDAQTYTPCFDRCLIFRLPRNLPVGFSWHLHDRYDFIHVSHDRSLFKFYHLLVIVFPCYSRFLSCYRFRLYYSFHRFSKFGYVLMHLYGSSKTNKRDTSLIPLHCVLILDDSECCSRRHTPTMALGGWVATFPFAFLTLKHNKLNLHIR